MDEGLISEAIFEFSAALEINSKYGRARKNLDLAKVEADRHGNIGGLLASASADNSIASVNQALIAPERVADASSKAPAGESRAHAQEQEEDQKRGDQFFVDGDMENAVAAYTNAIKASSTHDENLYAAVTHFAIGSWTDCRSAGTKRRRAFQQEGCCKSRPQKVPMLIFSQVSPANAALAFSQSMPTLPIIGMLLRGSMANNP